MLPFSYIDQDFIEEQTDFAELVLLLEKAFASAAITVPMRHHHDFANPIEQVDSTLLLMPAWQAGLDIGVKVVTVSPQNGQYGMPSIQGSYLYMDAHKGSLRSILDAKALTVKRTAAASALASKYLSRTDSKSLLMIGTGALAPNLIQAHAAVRPIEQVYVWGRDVAKANDIVSQLQSCEFQIEAVGDIGAVMSTVDIISTATLSPTALVEGDKLRPGQHVDLVGSYKKTTREADDEVIRRSSIYVDTMAGGLSESGDILIPLNQGLITTQDIEGDLFGLCSEGTHQRKSDDEITMFKSVGHALEDLVAAGYYYNQFSKSNAK